MSDHGNPAPRPTPPRAGYGSAMAFIVGGLVVAVGVIFYVFASGDAPAPAGQPGTSVTIENTAPPPAVADPVAPPAPAAPAPPASATPNP